MTVVSTIASGGEHVPATPSNLLYEKNDVHANAVSWSAIFAGAAGAAALSLILLILGTGLGLSSVSPWSSAGVTAATVGVSTILWVTLTQLLASGLGGYLAGRLRTRWTEVHTDEVYFRDTAHGFLAWAIASLMTAAFLTSVIGSILGGGVQAGTSVAGGLLATATPTMQSAIPSPNPGDPLNYFADALFRKNATPVVPVGSSADMANIPQHPAKNPEEVSSVEVVRIFANGIQKGALPPEDAKYLGQLVVQRTGLSEDEAEKRVSDQFSRAQTRLREIEAAAKETTEKARKASAYAALWLFISLLAGAFFASLTATYGGRQRDA